MRNYVKILFLLKFSLYSNKSSLCYVMQLSLKREMFTIYYTHTVHCKTQDPNVTTTALEKIPKDVPLKIKKQLKRPVKIEKSKIQRIFVCMILLKSALTNFLINPHKNNSIYNKMSTI